MMDIPHDLLFDYPEALDMKRIGNTAWEPYLLQIADPYCLNSNANPSLWDATSSLLSHPSQLSTVGWMPNQVLTHSFVQLKESNSLLNSSPLSDTSRISCTDHVTQPFVSPVGNGIVAGGLPLQRSSTAHNFSHSEPNHLLTGSPFKSGSSTLEFSDDSMCSDVTGPSQGCFLDEMMHSMFDERDRLVFHDAGLLGQVNTPDESDLGKPCGWIDAGLVVDDTQEGSLPMEVQGDTGYWVMHESNRMPCETSLRDANLKEHSDILQGTIADSHKASPQAQCPEGLLPTLNVGKSQTGSTYRNTLQHGLCTNVIEDIGMDNLNFMVESSNFCHKNNLQLQPTSCKRTATFSPSVNAGVDAPNHSLVNSLAIYRESEELKGRSYVDSKFTGVGSEASYTEISLVHLVIAAAEAVVTHNMDLASVILARLNELVSCSESNMQRVASYFSAGLQSRIGGGKALVSTEKHVSRSEKLSAFQILHEISPYIKFGHFTANQAILEAVDGEKQVHIVDFEIMEGIQWPPLMQALARRKGGAPRLHITALCRPCEGQEWPTMQVTGRHLSEFATSVGLSFTFSMMRVGKDEGFNASALKVMKGEAVVGNCMLHLPHMPHRKAASVASFLRGVRAVSPVVLTLVEEELGSSSTAQFLSRALHHYCAVFDSLEACLSGEAVVRMLVERVFFGPRIRSTVAGLNGGLSSTLSSSSSSSSYHCWGETEHATTYSWCSLARSMGFKSLSLSANNLSQARLLLGLYQDGFKLEEQSNRLLLGWRSRNVYAASVWS